jgi:hypothetical protein
MFRLLRLLLGSIIRMFYSRDELLLENLALRQQLAVLKARKRRPRLSVPERLFWVFARRCWAGWGKALIVVTPTTAVRWHRAGHLEDELPQLIARPLPAHPASIPRQQRPVESHR